MVIIFWSAPAFTTLSDPTRPMPLDRKARPVSRGGLILQSTLVSPNRRVAVINGKILAVGDKISNAVITEINTYQVTVRRNNKEIVLRLWRKLAKPNKRPRGVEYGQF